MASFLLAAPSGRKAHRDFVLLSTRGWVVRGLGIPDQVVRLAVLFAAAIAVLIVARQQFVPKTFGQLGHYRAAALDSVAGRPLRYAGLQACVECHAEVGEKKSKSYHRGLSCEVCHGAANDHAADPGVRSPAAPKDRGTCLHCHDYQPSRPTGFPQIIERLHNPLQACVTCHNPHDPTPPQVPGPCSACHATIARTKAISHHVTLDCETCHETAPEHKQNPRAYLPKKPVEREFCGRCHAEGAQSPAEIPRIDMATHGGRYLCWQCHYPHYPEGR